MPTYVYKFIDTDETIEVQQSFTDATLTEYAHPTTGETLPVKKVFLPVGVTFKGDGFYKTDSRSAAKKSKTDKSATAKGETSTSSKESSSGSSDAGSNSASKSETSASSGASSSSPSPSSSGD